MSKKQNLFKILLLILTTCLALCFSSCITTPPEGDDSDSDHEHSFVDGKCECGTEDPDYVAPCEHTPAEAVRENEVTANCVKEGSYDEVIYCSSCEAEIARETKTTDKLDHTPADAKTENVVNATCASTGSYDEVVYCSACGTELSRDAKNTDKLAHDEAEAIKENEVASTCSKEGSYDEVVYCSVCEAEISRSTKFISKLAHNYVDGACSECGAEDPSVCKHSTLNDPVQENKIDATCTSEGSYDEVIYCSSCEAEISRETKTTDKLAHTPADATTENVVNATCTATGSYDEVVKCSLCGEEISRTAKVIEKLDHTPAEAKTENVVNATCASIGSYDEVIYCSACGTELSRDTKTTDKLAHNYADGICTNCGATDPNYIPPHEHSFVDGKCECGETDPNYIPPHVHKFVEGICECGVIDPDYIAPEDPEIPDVPVETENKVNCDFTTITGGQQYANETYTFGDIVSVSSQNKGCYFNTELRLYDSTTNNGYVIISADGIFTNLSVNAGYKAATLQVYGSTDGTTWEIIGNITTKASYATYALSIDRADGYKFIKLDASGNQIRIKSAEVTVISFSSGNGDPVTPPDSGETHEHKFVDGKCECGESDPNYTPDEPTTPPTADYSKGYYISCQNANGTIYFNGTVSSGRFGATTDKSKAVLVYLEGAKDGFRIYFEKSGVKNYIAVEDNSAGGSFTEAAASASVFEWNADNKTFAVVEDANNRAFGTDSSKTYLNFSTYDLSGAYSWGAFTAADGTTPPDNGHIVPPPVTDDEGGLGGNTTTGGIVINGEAIPEYSGNGYYIVNGNNPFFTAEDKKFVGYEFSALDNLNRATGAFARLTKSLMPTDDRDDISHIKPTGWNQAYYSSIGLDHLYDRSHLIAHSLLSDDVHLENFVTGTVQMNQKVMTQFEDQVRDLVKAGADVLYRVTPVYVGNNLLCSGLLLEAYSVNDNGEDLCFCVFIYNVQPGVEIDYATGKSQLA